MKKNSASQISEEELENIADGYSEGIYVGVYGTVHGVICYDGSSCLGFRDAPEEKVLYDDNGKALGWKNGEETLVYPDTRAGKRIKATRQYGVRGWTEADKVWY